MSGEKQEKNLFSGVSSEKFKNLFAGAVKTTSTLFSNLKPSSLSHNHKPVHIPSTETVGGSPTSLVICAERPAHLPAVKLSRLPAGLNRKSLLQSNFQRFGSICRIVCQPSLDCAYVAFDSVTAAQNAKRHGLEVGEGSLGLPSTVLLTMAQCRVRTLSSNQSGETSDGSVPTQPPQTKHEPVTTSLFSNANLDVQSTRDRSSLHNTAAKPQSLFGDDSLVRSTPLLQPRLFGAAFTHPEVTTNHSNSPPESAPVNVSARSDQRLTILQNQYQLMRDREQSLSCPSAGGTTTMATAVSSYSDLLLSQDLLADDALDVTATAIKGTCPDMCPELERYLREAHHRVSIFECFSTDNFQMDHSRAVKDYQRSSADQLTPLPCELRPTGVLQHTLLYLLANIADRPELDESAGGLQRSLWKPWYEFMWTRTRAVRKDIAQQRLCCPLVVGVVERIARFHIFCAARLVDQPVDSFDPRINSENLTQCLQTLKEMYNDLADRGELCSCEPEFRAYMLLMKLNDQSALNEVQKLPEYLLRSNEVRFAVRVHEAVTTNNYIRFFRCVRGTSFLNACLLHRYFVQLRSQALIRFSAAFSGHPKREVQYPLETLVHQLGFDDEREAKMFCECWGLATSSVEHCVIFERTIYPHPPEIPWTAKRSFQLIEQKRSGIPLSILLNNGPIDPEDARVRPVHSSFDSAGRFSGNQITVDSSILLTSTATATNTPRSFDVMVNYLPNAALLRSAALPQATTVPVTTAQVPRTTHSLTSFQRLLPSLLDTWLGEWVNCSPVARECMTEEQVIRQLICQLTDQLVGDLLFAVARETLADYHHHQSLLDQISVDLHDQLLELTVGEALHEIAQHELAIGRSCMDVLDLDLVSSQIALLARHNWLTAAADEQFRYWQLRRCLARLRECFGQRQQLREERVVLERCLPPASPDLHPLTLVGRRASDCLTDLHQQEGAGRAAKIPRFSQWAHDVDRRLTWQPMEASPAYASLQPLVLVCPRAEAVPARPGTSGQFTHTLLAWLQRKLFHLRPRLVTDSDEPALVPPTASLICLGPSSSNNKRGLSANWWQTVGSRLLLLTVLPIEEQEETAERRPDQSLRLPCDPDGVYRPTPVWSSLLQDRLDSLAASRRRRGVVAGPVSPTHHHPQSPQPPPPSSAQWPAEKSARLVVVGEQLIWLFLDRHFFRPLDRLARHWRSRRLVDPVSQSDPGCRLVQWAGLCCHCSCHYCLSLQPGANVSLNPRHPLHWQRWPLQAPEAILYAYHSMVVDKLLSLFPGQLDSQLITLVRIPTDVHTVLCQLPSTSKSTADDVDDQLISWQQLRQRWSQLTERLQLTGNSCQTGHSALDRVEQEFAARACPGHHLPPPLGLAPWLTLCLTAIRGHLVGSRLETGGGGGEPDNHLQALVESLQMQLLNRDPRELEEEEESAESPLARLAAHFALLREPSLTRPDVIRASVETFRRRQITGASNGKAGSLEEPSAGLRSRLDRLDDRLSCLEQSVHCVLGESLNSSALSSSRSSSSAAAAAAVSRTNSTSVEQ